MGGLPGIATAVLQSIYKSLNSLCRYGQDGQSISPAFVIAVAGTQTFL